ncbi:mitochondrial chaperone [Ophidiomyces ophidiicola]|uniref:mitochondrial chaperone n=1 Tax=Ophidiomyces ophidiicola TaxID=1387563 RepID=UPI0020C41583|nr:mitochondrial chaperone [Ophidiomyces ophidiicola]KAI1938758.1 mitochondrial chaperone [Ophidiomyces ophidiicola]KAI2052912.1 mitochondrial chaperone [Ophidiomyces ophidiicola]
MVVKDGVPDDADSKTSKSLLRRSTSYLRLLVYADPTFYDILLLLGGILAATASGVSFPLLGVLFGQVVDDLNSATCNAGIANISAYQSSVNDKVLKVVYVGIAYFILAYISIVCWSLTGERLAQRIRQKYFRALLNQDIAFFDNLPAGAVSSRLNGDIATIQNGTSEKVGLVLNSISFFVSGYIVAFIKDAKLGGALVSLLPAFLLMSLLGGAYIQKYTGRVVENVTASTSVALEGLSNIMVVQALTANSRLEAKFAGSLTLAKKAGIKKSIAAAIQAGLLFFISYSANALAYWQGSKRIADAVASGGSGTTVGSIYTVIFILVDASLILSTMAPFFQFFDSASMVFQKLEVDISKKPAINGSNGDAGASAQGVSGHIELRNVSFTYESRPEKPVLQDITLSCPVGSQTALVGLSGSGKSTVASLMMRFYDPTRGSVLLDGQDIKEFHVDSLRSCISLVQQEPSLLERSIFENIALGLVNSSEHSNLRSALQSPVLSEVASAVRGGQDLEEAARPYGIEVIEIVELVKNAAAIADVTTFVTRLKYGFGTLVGSSGSLISGGQKQRISLARALIKNPKILVLDEATASLDSASEYRVQTALEKAAVGRTVVTIAHRLSTIRNADNIVVMRNGDIVEQGTHSELLAKEGSYADLIRLQNLNVRHDEDNHSARSLVTDGTGDSPKKLSDEYTPALDEKLNRVGDIETEKPIVLSTDVEEQEDRDLDRKRPLGTTFRALWVFFRPFVLVLLMAFIAAVVVGGTYSACATVFGHTVGDLSPCKGESRIRWAGKFYALMFFVLALVEFFANFASWSLFGFVAEKVVYKIRILSFRALLEQNLQWHESNGRTPSILLTLITKDGNALSGLTGSVVGSLVSVIVNFVTAIILTHIIAWKIALVFVAVVPLMLGAGAMRVIQIARFEQHHADAFAKSIGITIEAVNSIKTVSSFSLQQEIFNTYHRSLQGPNREITQHSLYASLWLAISYGLSNFLYALAYWWGAKRIIAGDYSQTQFFIVLLALLVSAQLWGQMFTLAPDVSRAFMAVNRVLNLLDLGKDKELQKPPKDAADAEAGIGVIEKFSDSNTGGISVAFKRVAFAYPARPDVQVLRELDLNIQPGQFAALVGPSGAGKSTIISLVERMYSPSSGSIEIDNKDISKYEGVAFRDNIALVSQDNVLFDGSIRFNIALGARPGHEPTNTEIEEACKIANIHDTITKLPEGYDTYCGPNGNQLSGGQKQRLAIARALIRKPRLLLLDESTSALDAESEKLLQDGLEKAAQGITVIAIAHRLNTIQKADIIFLIEDGRCVDKGSHRDLMERSESYRVNALHQAVDGVQISKK